MSTKAADVRRQRRMQVARLLAASVGYEMVQTDVIGKPSVVIVVVNKGDQLAIRLAQTPGWAMVPHTDQFGKKTTNRLSGLITSPSMPPVNLIDQDIGLWRQQYWRPSNGVEVPQKKAVCELLRLMEELATIQRLAFLTCFWPPTERFFVVPVVRLLVVA